MVCRDDDSVGGLIYCSSWFQNNWNNLMNESNCWSIGLKIQSISSRTNIYRRFYGMLSIPGIPMITKMRTLNCGKKKKKMELM